MMYGYGFDPHGEGGDVDNALTIQIWYAAVLNMVDFLNLRYVQNATRRTSMNYLRENHLEGAVI